MGNNRQIDFLGLFHFEEKFYIGIGDIKSITPSKTFTDHFDFYLSKLREGRSQVIDSKNDIKQSVK